jgi:hypothetical protein
MPSRGSRVCTATSEATEKGGRGEGADVKKLALAVPALVATVSFAHAAQVIPLLSTLPARVTALEQKAIKVEITAPAQQDSGEERIAAQYTGCVAEGQRTSASTTRRPAYEFHTLTCNGKPPIAIKGVAMSSRDWAVGLKRPASVGSTLTVLLTRSAVVK